MNMKIRYSGLLLTLLLMVSMQGLSQNRLLLGSDIFYSDTIATSDLSLTLDLDITNSSPTFYGDSVTIVLKVGIDTAAVLFDDSLKIGSGNTENLQLSYNYNPGRLVDRKNISLEITPYLSTFSNDTALGFLTVEYKPTGKIIPEVTGLSFPDSLFESDTPTLSFDFVNSGEIDYVKGSGSPSIELYAMVNGVDETKELVGVLPKTELRAASRDIVPFSFRYKIDRQYLVKGGGNVIVVWPIGFLSITPDSTKDTFYYDLPNNINQSAASSLSIFPNPANNVLMLSDVSMIESVRLYDMAGRDVSAKLEGNTIPISRLESGTYQIHITLKDGSQHVSPVIVGRN